MWPDRRLLELFGIEHPILQAPMAGSSSSVMAIAVAEAGGLGSLPCATLNADEMLRELTAIRDKANRPVNANFFCHRAPSIDADRERAWKKRLEAYYVELGVDPNITLTAPARAPFDDAACRVVESFRPEIVSFHFGLPDPPLLDRVRKAGAKIISSATSVREARFLESHGCDAIIAQGTEAGGHRASFLFLNEDDDPITELARGLGTMALVPQIVDAVKVPVIAAGGIGDARGIVAAFALGAAGVQLGTAYLFSAEAKIAPHYRDALLAAKDDDTVFTNIFTGRPARGIVNRSMREVGPISDIVPDFPRSAIAMSPLRSKAESNGSGDFSSLWSGQAARLSHNPSHDLAHNLALRSAADITRDLASMAQLRFIK
jgi:nitronate monooxygenase